MENSYKMKKTGLCSITLLVCWALLPVKVPGAGKIAMDGIVSEEKTGSLVIRDVGVEEMSVMKSSSEHFVLEWVGGKVVEDGGEQKPALAGESTLPKVFSLSQNYPNPFNPTTTVIFNVPGKLGEGKQVRLTIYDIRGRLVKLLIDSELEPGTHRTIWDGRNDRGERVSSGIYLYRLASEDKTFTKKMTILK